jgi:tetratricopeptide (TPR) repeat protein
MMSARRCLATRPVSSPIGTMIPGNSRFPPGTWVLAATMLAVLAGCAAPTSPPGPATAAPTGADTRAAAAPPAAPAPPPAPEISPAQAKAQAQRLAIEAVDQLQNGDEASARSALERALSLDPANELARKLTEEIKADAQKELGPVFFRYTVQRDDSLSKLAQQFMGDRFRFWILAKYNDIPNPSKLAAGQVIKIPGRAPATPPAGPRPAGRPGETADPNAKAAPAAPETAPAAPPRDDVTALLQKGTQLQANGDLESAYATFADAAARFPGNQEALRKRDGAKVALVQRYDREATQAFQRQNLDLAIAKWDKLLEIDPANQKAKLERDRATDLKKRLNEKFGTQ